MTNSPPALHVTLVATPDTQVSPLSGLYETFNAFSLLSEFERDLPKKPFIVEIVAPDANSKVDMSGLSVGTHQSCEEIEHTDIVIVPLMMVKGPDWVKGRYPVLVNWLRTMYSKGAIMCSACTGILLLAETGLLDGRTATIHWAFAPTFHRNLPNVKLKTKEILVTAGDHHEFIMTGGVMSWHDLALYLIARFIGPMGAQAISRFLMLQWHAEGQAPYIIFIPKTDHDDALILQLQKWLRSNFMLSNAVEELVDRSGLPRRTLERRFRKATKYSPLNYIQNLRIAEARRKLERTNQSVEKICFKVGYENTAFFRRLFKRITKMSPGAYRRKFHLSISD